MSSLRQAPLIGRRALVIVLLVVVAGGLIVVFSGTLTRSTDVGARAEQAQEAVATLEARLAAGEAELEFFESEEFIRWQARAFGFGNPGERRFALADDAPQPAPITPIGPMDGGEAALAPFDAWMELLFGP